MFIAGLGLQDTASAAGSLAEQADRAKRTVIVANKFSAESVWLAKQYAKKRNIPKENILYIRTENTKSIGWGKFINEIFNPLREKLIEDKWILGRLLDEKDAMGRQRIEANAHRIAFLVTMYEVPYRINNDKGRLEKDKLRKHNEIEATYTVEAALDTELALLALDDMPAISVVANPLYKRDDANSPVHGVIRVSRLDGPDEESCARLVDDCIEVEMRGLRGRAFVDAGGPYPEGEAWMKSTIATIKELGFDLEINWARALAGLEQRLDGLALYFGWHSPFPTGAMAEDSARILPGGIGFHIYSYSGDIRRGSGHWSSRLLEKGAAMTVGNVTEPYLAFTHNPDILLDRLSKGWLLGDAMMCSLPTLSWQAMHIGDPLYLPFLVDPEDALAVYKREDPNIRGYAVVRCMNILDASGKSQEAVALGVARFAEQASLPLALRLLERADDLADRATTLSQVCDYLASVKGFDTVQIALGLELAEAVASKTDRVDVALSLAKQLFKAAKNLDPVPVRKRVARFGLKTAKEAGDTEFGASCQGYLDERATAPK